MTARLSSPCERPLTNSASFSALAGSRSETAMFVTAGCPAARRARNVPIRPDPMMPSPIPRARAVFDTCVT